MDFNPTKLNTVANGEGLTTSCHAQQAPKGELDLQVNYQYFREGEMKAWWEYLQASGAKFATIGMLGPLPGKNYAVVRLILSIRRLVLLTLTHLSQQPQKDSIDF